MTEEGDQKEKVQGKPSSLWRSLAGVGGIVLTIGGLMGLPTTLSYFGSSSSGFSFGYLFGNVLQLSLGLYLIYYAAKKSK
jgi:hypothetical protein